MLAPTPTSLDTMVARLARLPRGERDRLARLLARGRTLGVAAALKAAAFLDALAKEDARRAAAVAAAREAAAAAAAALVKPAAPSAAGFLARLKDDADKREVNRARLVAEMEEAEKKATAPAADAAPRGAPRRSVKPDKADAAPAPTDTKPEEPVAGEAGEAAPPAVEGGT